MADGSDGRLWIVHVRVAIVLGGLLAFPLALAFWFGAPSMPTPTQAALAGWFVWGVPLTALAANVLDAAPVKTLLASLFAGWGLAAMFCGVAALAVPGYPSSSRHEALCFVTFVAAAFASTLWCTRALHTQSLLARGSVIAVASVLAVTGSYASWTLFGHELATHLPLRVHPIRQHNSSDVMGGSEWFVAASMTESEVREYVRTLELAPRPDDLGTRFPPMRRPAWFAPREAKAVWHDALRSAKSTSEHWSWTIVIWDGDTMWATSGLGWM